MNITSPNFPLSYPPGVVCDWIVSSTSGSAVYFRFIHLDIKESLYCNSDYVVFSNLPNERRCGVLENPENFTKMIGELSFRFISDQLHQASGFVMEAKTIAGEFIAYYNQMLLKQMLLYRFPSWNVYETLLFSPLKNHNKMFLNEWYFFMKYMYFKKSPKAYGKNIFHLMVFA